MPDRGPIGANCLANPRDFKTPCRLVRGEGDAEPADVKWCGKFHVTELGHSPLDVVAWHGNYAPYKYDLATFSPVGAILFDHPDPSIFTVLTAPSGEEGTANIDFVIFPPRWLVAEDTFRPPWYHRNIMSEFMGLIHGQYDAKEEGFVPGGISLHNMMLAHGPDAPGFEKASRAELKPVKLENTMAFMFETRFPQFVTRYAAESGNAAGQLHRLLEGSEKALQRHAGRQLVLTTGWCCSAQRAARRSGRAGRCRQPRCWRSVGACRDRLRARRDARPDRRRRSSEDARSRIHHASAFRSCAGTRAAHSHCMDGGAGEAHRGARAARLD